MKRRILNLTACALTVVLASTSVITTNVFAEDDIAYEYVEETDTNDAYVEDIEVSEEVAGDLDAANAGWKKTNGKWWYQRANGSYPKSTWEKIDGKWYLFDGAGYIKTGWANDGGKWYYLENSGAMAAGKWVGNYYLNSDGTMATNTWIGNYYVGADGAWVKGKTKSTGTWKKSGSKWWYQYANGKYPANKWEQIDGAWYHFDKSGYMDANKWIGDYYVDKSGVMATNTWIGSYYVGADGKWDKTKTNSGTSNNTGNTATNTTGNNTSSSTSTNTASGTSKSPFTGAGYGSTTATNTTKALVGMDNGKYVIDIMPLVTSGTTLFGKDWMSWDKNGLISSLGLKGSGSAYESSNHEYMLSDGYTGGFILFKRDFNNTSVKTLQFRNYDNSIHLEMYLSKNGETFENAYIAKFAVDNDLSSAANVYNYFGLPYGFSGSAKAKDGKTVTIYPSKDSNGNINLVSFGYDGYVVSFQFNKDKGTPDQVRMQKAY